jgi:TPP-dependent pyruvate/acetoin dehydrogenase alpha subunit
MTIATRQAAAGLDIQKLLRMYRQMAAIRLFEERVNDLYTRALMPDWPTYI